MVKQKSMKLYSFKKKRKKENSADHKLFHLEHLYNINFSLRR